MLCTMYNINIVAFFAHKALNNEKIDQFIKQIAGTTSHYSGIIQDIQCLNIKLKDEFSNAAEM